VDAVSFDAREAARDADLVVLCTPAGVAPQMLDAILPACSTRAVVTDVASTKARICGHARATWPSPRRFVGSHPMAGSEKFGPEHADADLYDGCVTMVERGDDQDPAARQTVIALWRALGARVVEMAPAIHDAIVARTSHIPHIMAACASILAAEQTRGTGIREDDLQPLIGRGFRDFTRIAASRPEIWRDICLSNRDAIVEGLRDIIGALEDIQRAIAEERGDRIEGFFRSGNDGRRQVLGE
jgi:prephenate dehydrogenase